MLITWIATLKRLFRQDKYFPFLIDEQCVVMVVYSRLQFISWFLSYFKMTNWDYCRISIVHLWEMSISLVSPAINLERTVFPGSMDKLQSLLIRCSLINLFIVALMGVVLRAFPFLSSFPLDYKNMLHGHSHFAFGGWVMPALFGLILKNFPGICDCANVAVSTSPDIYPCRQRSRFFSHVQRCSA